VGIGIHILLEVQAAKVPVCHLLSLVTSRLVGSLNQFPAQFRVINNTAPLIRLGCLILEQPLMQKVSSAALSKGIPLSFVKPFRHHQVKEEAYNLDRLL